MRTPFSGPLATRLFRLGQLKLGKGIPAVSDAAVVGMPSEEWGEAVVAAVVISDEATTEQLQKWVKEHMRSSRVPERIEFWDELPYNETGKLLRRVVKERLA
jgi:acyl-coenzyme A synthetase/AMP-(fatty) acid ligase